MRLQRCVYAVTSASLIAATLLASPVAALAAWDAGAGEALVGARAATLPAGVVPVVGAHGSSVTVDWPAMALPSGADVRGYRVSRTDAVTGGTVPAQGGCSGVLTRTRCVDGPVPRGLWAYEVVALVGDAWTTTPGIAAPVTVGVPNAITAPPIAPPASASPTAEPTAPAPTTSAPTAPAPSTSAPAAPAPTTTPAPSTAAPTAPAPTSTPPRPAPTSVPAGPAPTVSPAPSAEPTKAPAPSAKPTHPARPTGSPDPETVPVGSAEPEVVAS